MLLWLRGQMASKERREREAERARDKAMFEAMALGEQWDAPVLPTSRPDDDRSEP